MGAAVAGRLAADGFKFLLVTCRPQSWTTQLALPWWINLPAAQGQQVAMILRQGNAGANTEADYKEIANAALAKTA
jgi:hypothetical protein